MLLPLYTLWQLCLCRVVIDLPTIPAHLISSPVLVEGGVAQSLVFCIVLCRSLFIFFSFWPLYCLYFFGLRILPTFHKDMSWTCDINISYDVVPGRVKLKIEKARSTQVSGIRVILSGTESG